MPDRENILGRVNIAVMPDTTGTAGPFSYSKPCATSRPRIGQTAAIRAGLGGVRLINLFKAMLTLKTLLFFNKILLTYHL